MTHSINRRRFERFVLAPMYTSVEVRGSAGTPWCQGHVYNISEGGIQFELDDDVAPGSIVELKIALPEARADTVNPIQAFASVVWSDDDEGAGPVRLAAHFTGFASEQDRERLLRALSSGRYARAA